MLSTRTFGSTGLTATALGLGGAFLDQHGHDTGIATVRRALELGIGYFDTSPMYCRGRSQLIMGEGLRGGREPHLLATKLGYLPRPRDHRDEAALWAQLHDNLRQLGRDSVDVLQVHEADLAHWWRGGASDGGRIDADGDFDFADAPVMRVLREAKSRGLCRAIGITGNGLPEMTRLLRELDIDTFLLAFHYDLLHRGATHEVLPLAQRKGVATVLGGIFQCGRLAEIPPQWLAAEPEEVDEGTPPLPGAPAWMTPELQAAYRRLDALRRACGLSLVELTIRYLLADARAHVVLVGASTPAEVEAAVAAAGAGPLPDELHRQVESLAADSPPV